MKICPACGEPCYLFLACEDCHKLKHNPEGKRMNWMFEKLRPHIGHKIVCVYYGDPADPVDICIECETCMQVLVSAEDYEEENEK